VHLFGIIIRINRVLSLQYFQCSFKSV